MSNFNLLRSLSCFSPKNFKNPSFHPIKRCYALNFGNGNGNGHNGFKQKPECIKVECDPKIQRLDKNFPKKESLKKDQIGTYRLCPPAIPKPVAKCEDLPPEPQPPRRKRKPFVPASACKKPSVSLSFAPCDTIKEDKCKIIQLANCASARIPPKCYIVDRRSDCEPQKYKFPEFATCYKIPKSSRFEECLCQENKRRAYC